jgi:hypothetical protein
LLLKLTKSSVRHSPDNLPETQFAFCGQSQTFFWLLKWSPSSQCSSAGTPLLQMKYLEQSVGCGRWTVYLRGSFCGQLPGGKTWAATSCPKHARRAGSISDAGDMPERHKITTTPESSLSLLHCSSLSKQRKISLRN